MERFVIRVHPAPNDDSKLTVADAMLQVLDILSILEDAQQNLGAPGEAFVWRLETASTNSPLTITAIADPVRPRIDVTQNARRIKSEVSRGMKNLVTSGERPSWMSPQVMTTNAKHLFARTMNGVGATDIDFQMPDSEVIEIDRVTARAGTNAIEAIAALDVSDSLPERQAFGEIEGTLLAAGRYKNAPALQIRSELYGFIWCTLSKSLIDEFGSEQHISDVWKGKGIGVQGVLYYASGGKLTRVEAHDVRELMEAPYIDLASVLDPDFTAGMDPHEYLEKLHAGELA